MTKTILFTLITVFFTASGIWYGYTSHFNFGVFMVWVLAGVSLCYAIFHKQIDAFALTGVGFFLKVICLVGCIVFLCILGLILKGQFDTPNEDAQFLIVLGCAVQGEEPSNVLVERLDTAYTYYLAHPDIVIVVTGGQMPAETIAEAVVMQDYLITKGVPASQILVEANSISTEENFRFSKILLTENGYEITSNTPIIYITNGFHCMRAGLYAQKEGFANASALAAGLPASQILACYLREVFAVIYYFIFKSPSTGFLKNYIGLLHIFGKR